MVLKGMNLGPFTYVIDGGPLSIAEFLSLPFEEEKVSYELGCNVKNLLSLSCIVRGRGLSLVRISAFHILNQ